jgi:hypothetical protein
MEGQGTPRAGQQSIRAFVSWAHAHAGLTPEIWSQRVFSFAVALRRYGIDADLDHAHQHANDVDWSIYGVNAINSAEYVLIVASSAYKERWEGTGDPKKGAGAAQEANALKALFNKDRDAFLKKAKVVLLPGVEVADIPTELQASTQRFEIATLDLEGVSDLLRTLANKPKWVLPGVGTLPDLPPTFVEGVVEANRGQAEPVPVEDAPDLEDQLRRRLEAVDEEIAHGSDGERLQDLKIEQGGLRGALEASGAGPVSAAGTQADVHGDGLCDAGTWQRVATEIRAATDVAIFGIVQRPLLEALRSEFDAHPMPSHNPLRIRYFTSPPEAVLGWREPPAQTRVADRWQLGFIGLRNLIHGTGTEASLGLRSSLARLPGVFLDCIVVVNPAGGEPALHFFTELPVVAGGPTQSVRLAPQGPTRAAVVDYLEDVASKAQPLLMREFVCEPMALGAHPPVAPAPDSPFKIRRLRQFGQSDDGHTKHLMPVAAALVWSMTATGPRVLLKERRELTDADNFGRLSLIGARLQEADCVSVYRGHVSGAEDDRKALDDLWKMANKPSGFFLPMAALEIAVRRELFVSCGLEIEGERLKLLGFYVVDQSRSIQVGFAVYGVQLRRDEWFDEFEFAKSRTREALKDYSVRAFEDEGVHLNRFLSHAKDWLIDQAFGELSR